IPKRNVFGLHDPVPTKVQVAPKVESPLPKITLTGITTSPGYKLALFKVQYPAQQGQAPKEESLMLTEGQREGPIEVLDINEKSEMVRFNNSGTVMSLTFEKDSGKLSTNAPAVAVAPAPSVAANPATPAPNPGYPVTMPNPVNTNAVNPFPSPTGYSQPRVVPNRTLRLGAPNIPSVPMPPQTGAAAPLPQLPAAASPAKPLTPDQELLLKELEKAQGQQQLAPQ
ncbi:MAG TPA: hypothetical protein VLT36_19510, partial [Candidatus Dormibacteraeota bacterium]|nr:hypothetical protein [Candidatus Dormibacteraeota bacterium]